MGDDYLWDRSGEPDPDVARLERTLAKLRYQDRPYEIPDARPARVIPLRRRLPVRWALLATAAALAAGAALVWRGLHPVTAPVAVVTTPPPGAAPAFSVERIEGAPRVGATPIEATAQLGVGQWLETDPGARARIEVADIGVVEVSGRSRVRLTKTGPDQHRLDLERGTIAAKVTAPPRLFVVGTPAATAVDLGCAYTLDVDDRGAGRLRVTSGWVSLEDGGRASMVPAGASCETRPGMGPGTPVYDDAPPPLHEALTRFDFEHGGDDAVGAVLAAARRRDALTVWHLLSRVDAPLRGKVQDRLRALAPPPPDVLPADVLRLDPTALLRWRDAITSAGASITW
jgi:ferric-dicitrate binding protein FerR (iron transport regulator)